jgi:C1A family cysteine protease
MLNSSNEVSISNYGEETALLNGVMPNQIKIVMENAYLQIESIVVNNSITSKTTDIVFAKMWKSKKQKQDSIKIERIKERNKVSGQSWLAGKTELSELTFSKKKKIFGDPLPNLRGFEYYKGGVMDLTEPTLTKSASQVQYNVIKTFDWRNRHNQDWNTPAKDQGAYPTCALFSAVGATEAIINLYFNQHLDIDLAEQKPVICGWSRLSTLDHFTSTGAVYESCAPYDPDNGQTCDDVCPNPSEIIKIGGKESLHTYEYPYTEDGYKKMLIKHGPYVSGLFSMNHNMVLVGYTFDNSDGKTIWIFKNSWGSSSPYFETKTNISDLWGAYAPLPPVTFVNGTYTSNNIICVDNDGDGYYSWGIGSKPATCPTCRDEGDGDDSNSGLGPVNEFGYCALLVNNTQTWNNIHPYIEYADVIVQDGGNLTLNGPTIDLENKSSFVVELGATLIFTSGTIQ